FELGDDRLDAGAIVVTASERVGVVHVIVGGEDVDGEVQILPEARLIAAVSHVGAHGEDAPLAGWPIPALEIDLRDLPRRLSESVTIGSDPSLGSPHRAD